MNHPLLAAALLVLAGTAATAGPTDLAAKRPAPVANKPWPVGFKPYKPITPPKPVVPDHRRR